jgi:hypothetical protein
MLISWKYRYVTAPVPFIYIAIKSGLILPDQELLTVKQSHIHINHWKWKKRVIYLHPLPSQLDRRQDLRTRLALPLCYNLKIPIK